MSEKGYFGKVVRFPYNGKFMASQRKKVVRDWEASRNRILRQGLGGYSAPGEQFESSMDKLTLRPEKTCQTEGFGTGELPSQPP